MATDNAQDTSGFFGSPIPAVTFEEVGDTVTGRVTGKELRQQTDFDSGTLLFWQDGRPRMQAVITLECMAPTDDDDGLRNLYVRGVMQQAVRDALREANRRDLNIGDYLTVTYKSEDAPPRKGLNGLKRYTASVRIP